MTASLPQRSQIGTTLQASKWQACPVLLDKDEMQRLLEALGFFQIVQTSGLIPLGQAIISTQDFLEVYQHYLEALKKGELPSDKRIRPYFSSVFTATLDALYEVKMNDTHGLVKVHQPVIQLQAHRFDYSTADGKFRSMVLGYDSLSWGIQFSYPHLYQNENLEVFTVKENDQFPNTSIFKKLQRWMRENTIATPIEVEGKRVNVPIRLGKNCFGWINMLPQLQAKNLRIVV